MVQNMLQDRECWGRHLSLDPKSGLDPDGMRLRAAAGFEVSASEWCATNSNVMSFLTLSLCSSQSADFIIGNYWVWARIIENLAAVGYDGSNMSMFSYDWRLSPKKLQERDKYFSKLKAGVEVGPIAALRSGDFTTTESMERLAREAKRRDTALLCLQVATLQ